MTEDFAETAERRRVHYLAMAQKADEHAAKCTDTETQKAWEELAASWRILANNVAKDFKL